MKEIYLTHPEHSQVFGMPKFRSKEQDRQEDNWWTIGSGSDLGNDGRQLLERIGSQPVVAILKNGGDLTIAATFGQGIISHIKERSNDCDGGGHNQRAIEVVKKAMETDAEKFKRYVKDWAAAYLSEGDGNKIVRALFFLVELEAGKPVILIVNNPELLNDGSTPGTAFRIKDYQ